MKKILAALLALLMIFTCLPVTARAADVVDSGSDGGKLTWTLYSDGKLVISGNGDMKDYQTGEPPVSYLNIDAPWWIYKSQITSVVIQEGVISVGSFAFSRHYNLTSVTLPSTLKDIGYGAFFHCESLPDIQFNEELETIGGYAFFACKNLSRIILPDSVSYLGSSTFCQCMAATELHISTSMRELPRIVFCNCQSLTSVFIPKNITWIGDEAFQLCVNLTRIDFEHDTDDELKFELFDERYPSFGLYDLTETTIGVPAKKAVNPAIANYDWEGGNRTVSYVSTVAPTVVTSPKSTKVGEGSKASFAVECTGKDLKYQWYYKKPDSDSWTVVSNNGTSATCTLTAALRHDGYRYRCKVYNSKGSVYSKSALLTVVEKPAITSQPVSVTVTEGKTATFKVAASGRYLNYQWYYRKPDSDTWTKVSSGGTSATYQLTVALRHDGYKYQCKVSNLGGTITSKTAVLTVDPLPKPTITKQPKSVTVDQGSTATFKIAATPIGTGLTYQWYYMKPDESSWKKVSSNGTSATLKLTAELRHNGYRYRCLVKDSIGQIWSNTVKLTVNAIDPPKLISQTSMKSVLVGYEAVFEVTASGKNLTYQWYYMKPDETTWRKVSSGGTSNEYALRPEMRHNGYQYRCLIQNIGGSVYSKAAQLEVRSYRGSPLICDQPAGVTVAAGKTATFRVNAAGELNSYQWYYKKSGSSTWTKISSNGSSPVYSLTAETRHNGYQYRCLVSNAYGSCYTNTVTLTVN